MTYQDRPYQTDAITAIQTDYDKGVRRMLAVMATGTGKTVVFAKVYEALKSRLPGQMMVLAHTEELVEQNRAKIQEVNPTLKVGKEMAGEYADIDSDIISASVATLGRKGTARLDKFNWHRIDKLVIDEAHHSTTDAYSRVVGRFRPPAFDPNRLLLGVTATPNRSDGVSLAEVYDKISYVYSIRQAIADGWLVDIKGFRVRTNASLDGVTTKHNGDFTVGELADAVNNPERNRLIVATYKAKGNGRKTVAFTVDIQHAKDLAQEFNEAGVVAEAVWGEDPDREEKLRRHREGEIIVLCNCSVMVEGYDDWSIGVVLLCRPTQSSVLFAQMVGRATRIDGRLGNLKDLDMCTHCHGHNMSLGTYGIPYCGRCLTMNEVKRDCIVVDFVDGSSKHSLVTLPTLMGLQNTLDLNGQSLLWAVEQLEAAQEIHPSIDFTKLNEIDGLKALIESVDLFQIRFPKECESNSDLTWFRAVDGGFKLKIPTKFKDDGYVQVRENLLGKWEIEGKINKKPFFGSRSTIEEIFKVADEQVRERVSSVTLSCAKREGTWQSGKVTDGQIKMLARLYPKKLFPLDQMTAGDASRVIGERLNR